MFSAKKFLLILFLLPTSTTSLLYGMEVFKLDDADSSHAHRVSEKDREKERFDATKEEEKQFAEVEITPEYDFSSLILDDFEELKNNDDISLTAPVLLYDEKGVVIYQLIESTENFLPQNKECVESLLFLLEESYPTEDITGILEGLLQEREIQLTNFLEGDIAITRELLTEIFATLDGQEESDDGLSLLQENLESPESYQSFYASLWASNWVLVPSSWINSFYHYSLVNSGLGQFEEPGFMPSIDRRGVYDSTGLFLPYPHLVHQERATLPLSPHPEHSVFKIHNPTPVAEPPRIAGDHSGSTSSEISTLTDFSLVKHEDGGARNVEQLLLHKNKLADSLSGIRTRGRSDALEQRSVDFNQGVNEVTDQSSGNQAKRSKETKPSKKTRERNKRRAQLPENTPERPSPESRVVATTQEGFESPLTVRVVESPEHSLAMYSPPLHHLEENELPASDNATLESPTNTETKEEVTIRKTPRGSNKKRTGRSNNKKAKSAQPEQANSSSSSLTASENRVPSDEEKKDEGASRMLEAREVVFEAHRFPEGVNPVEYYRDHWRELPREFYLAPLWLPYSFALSVSEWLRDLHRAFMNGFYAGHNRVETAWDAILERKRAFEIKEEVALRQKLWKQYLRVSKERGDEPMSPEAFREATKKGQGICK